MRLRGKKIRMLFTAWVLSVVLLSGCAGGKPVSEEQSPVSESADNQSAADSQTEEDAQTDEEAEAETESGADSEASLPTVGAFETTDIEGTAYTEKIFEEHDLTLVNVFATWCTPCVQELPELELLYQEVTEQGVNVVGIVMDAVDAYGNLDEEAVEKARVLKERTGITYPVLVPDSGWLNGNLLAITAYPTTFFVDKDGNIVSKAYVGSGTFEDWKTVVENELADLGEEE